jgi:aminoglycoside phosphotransferase family enzyme/gluconate kinase
MTKKTKPPAPGGRGRDQGQSAIIAFLRDPQSHGKSHVQQIDTHLSHVFLTGDNVYKLKRAAKFDFVDYSTLDLRHHYCLKELDANRFWSPDLYRGVLPVRRVESGFTLGGETGKIVDWLVHMRRFPENARLDLRLSQGLVTKQDLTRFADTLSRLHKSASSDRKHGGAKAMFDLIGQISNGLMQHAQVAAPCREIHDLQSRLEPVAEGLSHQLDERRSTGKVKRCHGDLHLKNICFWRGELIGFDALEFDDDMRTIDVLYDLAFPVMDLIHHGRTDCANVLLNRYLGRTCDYAGLAVLDLYMALRASVRALAAAISRDVANARAYFATAERLIEQRPVPYLAAIGGRSGSGKSTISMSVAPRLGAHPGAIILRSDVLRKAIAGVKPEHPLQANSYRPGRTADVYERLRQLATITIKAGYSCILDATFLDADERRSIDQLAFDLGLEEVKIWLDAPAELLHDRIAARGSDASDANSDVLDAQLKIGTPTDWTIIDASGSIESTQSQVLGAILDPLPDLFTISQPNPAHDI